MAREMILEQFAAECYEVEGRLRALHSYSLKMPIQASTQMTMKTLATETHLVAVSVQKEAENHGC